MIRVIILNLFAALFFFSCKNDLKEIDKVINREMIRVEVANEVSMLYSDSAVVRVSIEGPVMLRHLDKDDPRQEFTEGVKVVFYGADESIQSILTANYAIRLERKNQIVVRDSVVWQSSEGEKLETEELTWEETKEKIFTNRFVTITKPDEIIYGYGFEADQDFSSWTIKAIEGTLKTEGIQELNED